MTARWSRRVRYVRLVKTCASLATVANGENGWGFRLLGALAGICRHVECGLAALSLSVPKAALALTRGYVDDDGPCVLVDFSLHGTCVQCGFCFEPPPKTSNRLFHLCVPIHSTWCALDICLAQLGPASRQSLPHRRSRY